MWVSLRVCVVRDGFGGHGGISVDLLPLGVGACVQGERNCIRVYLLEHDQ